MSKIKQAVVRFIADEEGVTALEYAMIAALIAVIIVGTVRTLGINISGVFDTVAKALV